MRLARIAPSDPKRPPFYAQLQGPAPAPSDPIPARGSALVYDRAPWLGGKLTGETVVWTAAELLCPVQPTKIVCVGRNYAAHARELGNDVPAEPLIFLKPPSALIGPGGAIVIPPESQRVEHEAELGVVLGRRARAVSSNEALACVLGYTCLGDITARDLQRKDVQFTRAKGFDTFCPVGPWIETELDPARLRVRAIVNGQVRQDGLTAGMIWDVPALIAFLSRVMTLEPGDVVATGTPEGVGPLVPGDTLAIEIAGDAEGAPGIGALSVSVVGAGASLGGAEAVSGARDQA